MTSSRKRLVIGVAILATVGASILFICFVENRRQSLDWHSPEYHAYVLRHRDSWFNRRCTALWSKLPASIKARFKAPANTIQARRHSAGWLNAEGPPATASDVILSALIFALSDPDAEVRNTVVLAIGNVGSEGKTAVPALIDAAKTYTNSVSSFSYCLGRIGPAASAAIPFLEQIASAQRGWSGPCAADALLRIARNNAIGIHTLMKSMQDANPEVRLQAAHYLNDLGAQAKGAEPALHAALRDSDPSVRFVSASALVRMGEVSEDVIQALTELMAERDPSPQQPPVMPRFPPLPPSLFQSAVQLGRLRAATVLLQAKPDSAEGLAFLKRTLSDQATRLEAAMSLAELGREPELVVPMLANALNQENGGIRLRMIKSLVGLASFDTNALTAIRKAVQDPIEEVRRAAEGALAELKLPQK